MLSFQKNFKETCKKMLNLTVYNNKKECKAFNIFAMNTVRLLNLVI